SSEKSAPAVPEISERKRWQTFFLCLLGWMFDHYDIMLFAYLAKHISFLEEPFFFWHAGESPEAIHHHNYAFMMGITLFMSGIGGVVCGGLADRFGRRRVMGWAIVAYSLCTGLSGLALGFVSLAIFRGLTG